MAENFALYTQFADTLPQEQMELLVDEMVPEFTQTAKGTTFTYRWPDLVISIREMPANRIAEHLRGFEGYVRQQIYNGKVPARGEEIIRRIQATRLVVAVEFQPERDQQERAEELLGRMCGGLRPIIFHANAIYDWMSRLILAPDGSFDPNAELD